MFKVGDVVRIKTSSGDKYRVTIPGTIGTIVGPSYDGCLKFKMKSDDSTFDIHIEDMELIEQLAPPKNDIEWLDRIQQNFK